MDWFRDGGQENDVVGSALELASENGLSNGELQALGGLRAFLERCCMECNRLLDVRETRIAPPRYMQDRDIYVREGMVAQRVICMGCYNRMRHQSLQKSAADRVKTKEKMGGLGKSLIGSYLTQL